MRSILDCYLSRDLCDVRMVNGINGKRHPLGIAGAAIVVSCHVPYPEPVVFQWQSSGNPVCLELRPQCTLECLWRNASVLPVVFHWSSSGFPVVFQCVPIIQINTGSPLTPLSASISQCGSSGIPVYLWLQGFSSVFQLCKLTLDRHWKTTGC